MTFNFAKKATKDYEKAEAILTTYKKRMRSIVITKGNGTDYLYETGLSKRGNEALESGEVFLSEYNRLAKLIGKKRKTQFSKGTSWHHGNGLRRIFFADLGLYEDFDMEDLFDSFNY